MNNSPQMEGFSFDRTIYPWALEYGTIYAYDYLDGDDQLRSEQRALFFSGEVRNPTLDYPKVDIEKLNKIEENLLAFRDLVKKDRLLYTDEIPVDELSKRELDEEALKIAYLHKINEKIAEVRLLKIVYSLGLERLQGGNHDAKYKLMKKFKRYSEFIYGKPSADIFAYSINVIKDELTEFSNSPSQELQNVISELTAKLPIVQPINVPSPSQEIFLEAKAITLDQLSDLISIEQNDEPEKKLDAQEIKRLFEVALNKLSAEGWVVLVEENSSRTTIHVSQEDKEVTIPDKKAVTFKRVQSLIFHELGVHLSRRVKGERSRLMLLGIGLDRYKDDEGIAVMTEQTLKDNFEEYTGLEEHLAVSLGIGIDGHPRDFREVFEILYLYYKFKQIRKELGKQKDSAIELPMQEIEDKAKDYAYKRCIRAFRGTSCDVPGVAFTKDIFYRESNIEVWDIISKDTKSLITFRLGKFDPANSSHIAILTQLGILESDLESLEIDGDN